MVTLHRSKDEFEANIARLTSKIPDSNGCILWLGTPSRYGYARTEWFKKEILIHRYICEKKIGRKLLPGEIAMHSCDVRMCINPNHIEPGSHAQNQADKALRGRSLKGVKHPQSKLNEKQVLKIFSDTRSSKIIAAEYCVSKVTVNSIRRGDTWAHITGGNA